MCAKKEVPPWVIASLAALWGRLLSDVFDDVRGRQLMWQPAEPPANAHLSDHEPVAKMEIQGLGWSED